MIQKLLKSTFQFEHMPVGLDLETVSCDLCGSRDYEEIYRKPDLRYRVAAMAFPVVVCHRCGLGFTNPRPTISCMSQFYPESFYSLRQNPGHIQRYEFIRRRYLPSAPGKLLDIGCHLGEFIAHLGRFGWKCQGCEFQPLPNPLNQDIHYVPFDRVDLAPEFDVITAIAVMEHVATPMAYFRQVSRLLKPGGLFVFLVTNLDSRASRDFFCEDIPRHLYFYSENTVRQYCERVALKVTTVEHTNRIIPSTSRGWLVHSVRRILGLPTDPVRVQIPAFKRRRAGGAGMAEVIAWTPVEALDRAWGPVYNAFTAMMKRNMSVLYVAQKLRI